MSIAVVDLETTGVLPSVDRVVEVGVVLLDDAGTVEHEFATLVDPGRDIGPTSVHGIHASDVIGAPTFAEVAPYLASLLSGRVVVAHNALFDLRFLGREFSRAGLSVELTPALCTMRLAGTFDRSLRSLASVCETLSIANNQAHTALADARATAAALVRMRETLGELALLDAALAVDFDHDGSYLGSRSVAARDWRALVTDVTLSRRPFIDPCRSVTRSAAQANVRERNGYLAALVSALPEITGAPATMAPYLAVLDQVLEDRLVSVSEADQLMTLAGELGCGPTHVSAAHRLYLDALATVALADDVVTDTERADLDRVAVLLGLTSGDVDIALTMVRSGARVSVPHRPSGLSNGDRIVFTGEMSRSRSDLEEAARAAGLEPVASVSKKTNVLVCADPDSQSGKARKARALGVRVISEPVFWESLALVG
ncbi:Putative exonuclease, RNase T and DNA polymerase III [Modestobacter italicus]|uniref:Exonuclease, RNase T and DNA polymerase III n=1 Tax=Modestobacter italicus (strain DSM 44449 / CECT 9708 / BC 501) TaxID=2732864 RepID=I4F1J7_MODI5|nr:exonuclease domain-containing protein [Modestobacter marinus]CCH89510.1 Putative exonuclease, RNase T and DNA polymerase III [Modestobacter marinus]